MPWPRVQWKHKAEAVSYVSVDFVIWKWMMWSTPLTSMPRAATSVATCAGPCGTTHPDQSRRATPCEPGHWRSAARGEKAMRDKAKRCM